MKNPIKFNHSKKSIGEAFGVKIEELDEMQKVITEVLLSSDDGRLSNLFELIIEKVSFDMNASHMILLGYYFAEVKEKLDSIQALKQIKKIVEAQQKDEKRDTGVINRLKELLS